MAGQIDGDIRETTPGLAHHRCVDPFRSRDRVTVYARTSYSVIDGSAVCFASESRSTTRWRTVTAWLRSLADIASSSLLKNLEIGALACLFALGFGAVGML